MNTPLVECVPNFSEGRDKTKIKAITDAIESVSDVLLLDVEMGAATNRTVVTFVGTPAAVGEAAFRAIAKAAQVIDMSTHQGAHPRMGATDVCPFVPVEGVTMEDCVAIARTVAARVGNELAIPVYLYEAAATRAERKNLAEIRKGEYEGFRKKILDLNWKPDFGPARFNEKSGATVIGAREFLIAYNITLNTDDKNKAADLAFALREKGRVARTGNTSPYYNRGNKLFYQKGIFPCGTCTFSGKTFDETAAHCSKEHDYDLGMLLRSNDLDPASLEGKQVYRPGAFKECKAIGWYVDEYKRAQISINLTNFNVTPPHLVLEEARKLAAERGLIVTGSEIVGLIPWQALLASGKFYLDLQRSSPGVPRVDILRAAVFSMGLNDVVTFDFEKKALGLPQIAQKALVRMSVADFTDEVSRATPAPGGGSISALAGSLAAALASMVANLTYGKEGTESKDSALGRIAIAAQTVKDKLIAAVDEDTNAFNAFMDALRMPQNTPEEKSHRTQKMQDGLKMAIEVPWRSAELCFEAMKLCGEVAEIGNPNSLTDAAVGSQMAMAGVRGALWNVVINLKDLKDTAYVRTTQTRSEKLLHDARTMSEKIASSVDRKLSEMIAKKHG